MSHSLPRTHPPSHSSSPSKSSQRAVPPPQPATGSRNPSLLPSPVFNEAHIHADESYEEPPSHSHVESAQNESIAFQPSFQPLFTLIEDPITREHHHPTVHYLFADDDNDIITDAACRSLADMNLEEGGSQSESREGERHEDTNADVGTRLPPKKEGVREHYIVVDIAPSQPQASNTSTSGFAPNEAKDKAVVGDANAQVTFEVTSAYSLSSEWQVLRTSITQAPTIGEADEDGLMLRIEGRGNTPPEAAGGKDKEQERLEEMMGRLKRGLGDVRAVMESGGDVRRGEGMGGGEE
jgi:hypothetical protein